MIDLTPATERTAALLSAVDDEYLDRPTPCPEMSVRTLLGHLHGSAVCFRDAAAKIEGPTTTTPPDPAAMVLPEDWRQAIPARLAELATAWQQPEAWTGMTWAGGQQMPGEVMGLVALDEVVLHGWDLAAATGQPYQPDEDAIAAAAGFCAQIPDQPEARDGLFGPRVDVGADASPLHRLLGLSGRDPAWRP